MLVSSLFLGSNDINPPTQSHHMRIFLYIFSMCFFSSFLWFDMRALAKKYYMKKSASLYDEAWPTCKHTVCLLRLCSNPTTLNLSETNGTFAFILTQRRRLFIYRFHFEPPVVICYFASAFNIFLCRTTEFKWNNRLICQFYLQAAKDNLHCRCVATLGSRPSNSQKCFNFTVFRAEIQWPIEITIIMRGKIW